MSDFIITQGTDSGIVWPIYNKKTKLPANIVGWTGVAQIRSLNTDNLIFEFSTVKNNMILEAGKITLVWTATQTLNWKWNQAKFGVELTTPEGKIARVDQGIVTLSKEVAK